MLILDGKHVSQVHRDQLKAKVQEFYQNYGRFPHLTVVLVGQDPASQVYVKNKEKACLSIGINSSKVVMSAETSQLELNQKVNELLNDDGVDGVLVQLPLPKGLSEKPILQTMDPMKDVDGFSTTATGRLYMGQKLVAPCTPQGVIHILKHYKIPIQGQTAVVIGRSHIVGRPMAQLMLEENATVIMCHSQTKNLTEMIRQGDIVIVAAGKPEFLGKSDFKKGAVVIDVGIHRVLDSNNESKIVGDVRYHELEGWVSAATPVPGGVGPMTITCLLENTVHLANLRQQMKKNK
jgi:methylenetetrahydrofolate dehydrogenase (NADP+)/methenyltetrahydrofolate cyclohydrolase